MGNGLKVTDSLPELLSLFGIRERLVKGRLSHADVSATQENPFELEAGQQDVPTTIQRPHQIVFRHDNILEKHFVGSQKVPGQSGNAPNLKARTLWVDNEETETFL